MGCRDDDERSLASSLASAGSSCSSSSRQSARRLTAAEKAVAKRRVEQMARFQQLKLREFQLQLELEMLTVKHEAEIAKLREAALNETEEDQEGPRDWYGQSARAEAAAEHPDLKASNTLQIPAL